MANQDSSAQSYLSKLSSWAQSSAPAKSKENEKERSGLREQKGADHIVNNQHQLSVKQYPKDCPPPRPQWFHAVDVPKRRPQPGGKAKEEKPPAAPKKYAAFSATDSKAIEAAFQKLIGDEGQASRTHPPNTSLDASRKSPAVTVPVNEDYLFDVDVEKRELAPAYWLGPVYDVRRGTWFYQDGNVQRPCDENLAAQLEEGYLKVKAWRIPAPQPQTKPRSSSQPRPRPISWAPGQSVSSQTPDSPIAAKQSVSDLRTAAKNEADQEGRADTDIQADGSQNTYRLFGSHMNSVVTYQDANTAWLLTDSTLARMSVPVYQRFAGGGHFAGVKLTRGYVQPDKQSESKDAKTKDGQEPSAKDSDGAGDQLQESQSQRAKASSESRRQLLHRQMSTFLGDSSTEQQEEQEEEMRKRDEREIEDDYDDQGDQGREISHLILVTHGIGQRLGLRLDSVNFVHDVNTLRKTLKAVYADSPDIRALNDELEIDERNQTLNNRVQVLPICWRHLLDFPKQSLRHNRKEHDIADTDIDDGEYPSLEDITVDGVPHVRNLICDMGLDILIYDSPSYKEHIAHLVLQECNRIYRLFTERNPAFSGKVSLIGHSLGSVILFDILCRQRDGHGAKRKEDRNLQLDFPVQDFYALGSPVGLYQMLGGRTIESRQTEVSRSSTLGDPAVVPASNKKTQDLATGPDFGENPVSRPKCSQIYNIFHPTDPIAYRMEPLISPAMAGLKPQPLPYTKRGIFGAPVGQGLTGIGVRVSQSVSSMWSSVASSLLTRGLGYGDESKTASGSPSKRSGPLSLSGPSNSANPLIKQGPVSAAKDRDTAQMTEDKLDRAATDIVEATRAGQNPPTLIDTEIETLYGGFEKKRLSAEGDGHAQTAAAKHQREWSNAEEQGKKLRREEAKVRRLNRNGRVDYAIQEGAFDINLIAAIASHISYFSDEDVSHFILSQMLSQDQSGRRGIAPDAQGKTA